MLLSLPSQPVTALAVFSPQRIQFLGVTRRALRHHRGLNRGTPSKKPCLTVLYRNMYGQTEPAEVVQAGQDAQGVFVFQVCPTTLETLEYPQL